MRMRLKELLIQNKSSEYIGTPEDEIFVTVSQKGQGLSRRDTSGNRTPVPFTGTRIKEGQFVYAKIGAFQGSFGIVPKSLNNAVVSKDFPVFDISDAIIPDFLLLSLLTPSVLNTIEKHSTGALLKRCKEEHFLNIDINVPPKNIQRKIVDIIQAVDTCVIETQRRLELLDELVKSRFIELFGSQCHNEKNYPYGKIDDVAEIYLGLTHTPEYIETGVKFISAKNTSCDYLGLSDVKYISKEEYASAPAGAKPRKGDVLFSRVGSNLGHPVILDIDEELCTFVSLGYLRTKGRVTNLYLKHWMRDDFFAEQVRRKVVGGGQPNLNTGWLKEFRIIIPPMDIQEQFAAFVEQTDKSKLAITETLKYLEELKASLMSQYFG